MQGMIILTLTAGVPALHPPPCSAGAGGQQCAGATEGQFAVLALSFLFIVVGAGGIRPCSLPFGADQFDPRTESGRRGINSFFNWYYFTLTIAVVGSST
jgi:peptide/histidine transporter 3/4